MYPIEKYSNAGWSREKLFTAPNTVRVVREETPQKKDTILFLGSLYPQKGSDELLEQYFRAYSVDSNVPKLIFIGDGSERARIESWISQKNLKDRISLTGAIYDDAVLGKYFSKAIVCVSPKQAGLTVLKSMGCGVAYVTRKDVITGGEIFNIQDGINGVLYEQQDELGDIILDLIKNPDKYHQMGRRAREHYDQNRSRLIWWMDL